MYLIEDEKDYSLDYLSSGCRIFQDTPPKAGKSTMKAVITEIEKLQFSICWDTNTRPENSKLNISIFWLPAGRRESSNLATPNPFLVWRLKPNLSGVVVETWDVEFFFLCGFLVRYFGGSTTLAGGSTTLACGSTTLAVL